MNKGPTRLSTQVDPNDMTLHDAVESLKMEMPADARQRFDIMVAHAEEDPKAMLEYTIIQLAQMNEQLNAIANALVNEGIIKIVPNMSEN